MDKIQISVVIPVKNGGPELELCLQAVRNSDYKDYEVIVVNDCSVDDTANIARKYGDEQARELGEEVRLYVIDKYSPSTPIAGARWTDYCFSPSWEDREEVFVLAVLERTTAEFTEEILAVMMSAAANNAVLREELRQARESMVETIRSAREEHRAGER